MKEMSDMAKRLVLSAIMTQYQDGMTFWITEQTHRCSDFGNNGITFRAKDGFELSSCSSPTSGEKSQLYVRGSCLDRDSVPMHADLETAARIRIAVAEYNAYFADNPEPAESAAMPPILTIQ
jgi:ribosomal protein S6E (S10)